VTAKGPSAVVLLGAQRFDPTLGEAVAELGVRGRIAAITAGWQERELEDEELAEHLGRRTVNLQLHTRGEELFAADPELRAAHRERQEALRHRQDFYRIRLEHQLDADHVIRQRVAPKEILAEQTEASIDSIRDLDRWHLAQCAREHEAFETRLQLRERPSVARHRKEIENIVADCAAIAIAGGHVVTLINRMKLFGIGELAGGRVVFAWSGGAMAISDQVVLFHDDPPQGPGASEVLDAGLGICPGVVVFPEPEKRLRLDRKDLVARMARRFSPAFCLALPARSRLTWRGGRFEGNHGVQWLRADGETVPFERREASR
jgi:hypothetical protein